MGYYSDYEISADPEEALHLPLDEILEEASGGYSWEYYSGAAHMNGKWYSAYSDIPTLSAKYPDVVFTVQRDGEDPDDSERFLIKAGNVIERFERVWQLSSEPA